MSRVLVVEDNETLALGLRRSLEAAGFEARTAADAEEGAEALAHFHPHLVVLDLMLPGRDGFEMLRDLRSGGSEVPVLILSARGEEIDKLKGFRLGADDYVVKPVGVMELIARVEAILRRTREGAEPEEDPTLRFGDVVIRPDRRTVVKDGEPVELTPKEFDLLVCLLRREGAVVDRDTLLTEVWGYKRPVLTRTVDTHVANLRTKLEDDPGRPRYILTVRKAGYRVADEREGEG